MAERPTWWAEGRLFENCNCELLCRAHIHYSKLCDHERCLFHWAIHIDEGAFGACRLDGLNAVIVGDTPRRMVDGGWTEAIYIDAAASQDQRRALLKVFKGEAGGSWAVLAGFVATWLEPRFVPIRYHDGGRRKVMEVDGLFKSEAMAIKGADGDEEVRLTNLFNQIHGPEHVLARGSTEHRGGAPVMITDATHAIYSRFSWSGA